MHSRIFSPKIGFICGMRKSASPRSAVPSAHRSRPAETAQRRTNQSDTADLRPAETEYPLPFRHNPAHARVHQSDRTAYRKGRTDRAGKQRAKALPSPVGTVYAVIADAVRSLPKKRPNSLSPHDRNVQERPRPDRRTETSAPRSERPCDLGSEKPAQSPCENSLRLFPNRSRFSHLPGLNPFRRTSDFSDRTPSENTDRRSSPTQTGNLTDGPSERYDPVP